jgi:hypothetical protein
MSRDQYTVYTYVLMSLREQSDAFLHPLQWNYQQSSSHLFNTLPKSMVQGFQPSSILNRPNCVAGWRRVAVASLIQKIGAYRGDS